jgi:hypothetical protein
MQSAPALPASSVFSPGDLRELARKVAPETLEPLVRELEGALNEYRTPDLDAGDDNNSVRDLAETIGARADALAGALDRLLRHHPRAIGLFEDFTSGEDETDRGSLTRLRAQLEGVVKGCQALVDATTTTVDGTPRRGGRTPSARRWLEDLVLVALLVQNVDLTPRQSALPIALRMTLQAAGEPVPQDFKKIRRRLLSPQHFELLSDLAAHKRSEQVGS